MPKLVAIITFIAFIIDISFSFKLVVPKNIAIKLEELARFKIKVNVLRGSYLVWLEIGASSGLRLEFVVMTFVVFVVRIVSSFKVARNLG